MAEQQDLQDSSGHRMPALAAAAPEAGTWSRPDDSGAGDLPPPEAEPPERPDGNNATIHHPDPQAEQHPARDVPRERGPYTTGNY